VSSTSWLDELVISSFKVKIPCPTGNVGGVLIFLSMDELTSFFEQIYIRGCRCRMLNLVYVSNFMQCNRVINDKQN